MYNILIAGKNSYIGNSIEKWMLKKSKEYCIHKISVHDNTWRKKNFSGYDVVINVAAVVHSKKNISQEEYKKVNCDLAVDIFDKCIRENVGQYIFFSTGAVYSQSDKKHKDILITKNSQCEPTTSYGKSKRAAEIKLLSRHSQGTKLCIIRPPMVYGENCKGNYSRLRKIAISTWIFPEVKNQRSVLYIDNLCEFIKLVIEAGEDGIFHPQDKNFVSISEIVSFIAQAHHHKIRQITLWNPMLLLAMNKLDFLVKLMGNFIYDKELSCTFQGKYQLVSTEDAIQKIEGCIALRQKEANNAGYRKNS